MLSHGNKFGLKTARPLLPLATTVALLWHSLLDHVMHVECGMGPDTT
jgi:hypothetical protein